MLTINDLRAGVYVVLNGDPYVVVSHSFIKMAMAKGIVRTTLRNLKTGRTLEQTFKGQEKLDAADVSRSKATYLYADGDQLYFMDGTTFDQFFIPSGQLGDQGKFLKEGLEVDVVSFNGQPISVELPNKLQLKIVMAPPGVRGDTAQGSVMKKATLETGQVVDVPLFVNQGDEVIVNTETGKYVSKAQSQ
ncbi:MAG: elongation factor P [Patescibacteria group bacterium]